MTVLLRDEALAQLKSWVLRQDFWKYYITIAEGVQPLLDRI